MEELTIVLAVFGEMVACIALGYEMRVIAEMRHRERERQRRENSRERAAMIREKYGNNSGTCNSL